MQVKQPRTIEEIFTSCTKARSDIDEGKYLVVRVQLHGIARFACWWFVMLSVVGIAAAIISIQK